MNTKLKSLAKTTLMATVMLSPVLAQAQILGDGDEKLRALLQEAVKYMYILGGVAALGVIGMGMFGRWSGRAGISLIAAMLLLVGIGGFMSFMFGVNPFEG